MNIKGLVLKSCAIAAFGLFSAQANASLAGDFYEGNDCPGGPGGFSACEIGGSPVIAKFDSFGMFEEANINFPTIDGSEFEITFDDETKSSGSWTYTPNDPEDPGITHWTAKAGNGYMLFSDDSCGGPCTVFGGDWYTPEGKELSHITFFDTAIVPVPAAVWLFGAGLLGLVGVARRKRA